MTRLKPATSCCRQSWHCLAEYDPEPLGSYARDERIYSTLYNYLSLLVNAEACTSPVPYGPLHTGMTTTRLLFGWETIEYRFRETPFLDNEEHQRAKAALEEDRKWLESANKTKSKKTRDQ